MPRTSRRPSLLTPTAMITATDTMRLELECRRNVRKGIAALNPRWSARLDEDHTIVLEALGEVSNTALTRDVAIEVADSGLPNTFVPGRNIVFFDFSAALAYRRGLRHIVGGMCETDYSGYPDCRDDTIKALQIALNLGMERRFVLHTPLMWIDKAQTWKLARDLGGAGFVDLVVGETHT
jgi:7-cyano-7-deazaguanine synthase